MVVTGWESGGCYLILVLFYSVKDFQNTTVLQWVSRIVRFGEVTFAAELIYCKASVFGRIALLPRLSVWD